MNLTEAYREIWSKKLVDCSPPAEQHISRVSWVAELFPDLPEGSLLIDLGCGSGQMLSEARHRNWRAIGYDCNVAICDWLVSQRYAAFVADLSLDKFDSSKLGNVSDADIVTCCDVIEHLIDPKFAMEQAYKALKPGGRLYVSTPNMAHWRRVVAMAKGDFPRTSGDEVLRDGGHVCYFCPGDLTNLLKSVGFSEVTMSYRSSDPVPTEYIRPMDVLAGLQIWHDFTYMIAEAIKN